MRMVESKACSLLTLSNKRMVGVNLALLIGAMTLGTACTRQSTSAAGDSESAIVNNARTIQTRDGVAVAITPLRDDVELPRKCSDGPLALGEECADDDEAASSEAILKAVVGFHGAQNPKSETLSKRDFHAKATACVAARVQVRPDLPQGLARGIFAKGVAYDAVLRFSNGSPAVIGEGGAISIKPDSIPDARAVAVKLLAVPGSPLLAASSTSPHTQDLLLTNHPTFFLRGGGSAMRFFTGLMQGTAANGLDAEEKASFLGGLKVIDDVFGERYWSQSAYRFGSDAAAKYSVRPCAAAAASTVDRADADYLRKAAAARLSTGDVCLILSVQLQRDPVLQPVEDPVKEWREADAPFADLATLTIAKGQDVLDSERHAFCEHLSFNPWNGTKEHKPLGVINRLRHPAYGGISAKRRTENGKPLAEPTGAEPFFDVLRDQGKGGANRP